MPTLPALALTDAPGGVNVYVHAIAACDTVTAWPPMLSVPVRAGPVFAATDTDTVPLPAPLAPLVTVSQLSIAVADQVHVVNAVTVNVVVAASDETDRFEGDTLALHGGGATATPLTATRSNAVTETASVVWLDTPSPINTLAAIAIVSVPTSFQVVPSADW